MATVRFNVDHRGEPDRHTRKLYARISTEQGRFKHALEVEVDPRYWDGKKQRLSIPRQPADSLAFNQQLEAFRARVMACWLASGRNLAGCQELLLAGPAHLPAAPPAPVSVQELIELRLADRLGFDSASTVAGYRQLRALVDQLNDGQPLPAEGFSYSFYARLRQHLVGPQGLMNSSANRFLSKCKATLSHAATRHTERLGEELAGRLLGLIKRLDLLADEEPDIIAPTLEDVLFLSGLDLSDEPELQTTRDRYVFACFTGPRHSDLNALEGVNLEERGGQYLLRYMPIKTKRRSLVQVPVNQFAYELVRRYLDPEAAHLLPVVDNRRDNEHLHRLLRERCGQRFYNLVTQVSHQGNQRRVANVPRWEAITFHTSRHFFAITLINLGVPLSHVQDLLGQKNMASTLRYAKAVAQDVQHSAADAFSRLNLPAVHEARALPSAQ